MNEPLTTALFLTVFGLLLLAGAVFTRALERTSIPVVLLFLILGMLAGSEGIGGLPFDNYGLAFRLGTIALILILFDGGLNTAMTTVRRSVWPASILATAGVAMTAALVALPARWLGLSWPEALLLGAIVSSTDAAAVFAVLRGGSLSLKPRLGATLELESGLNDPMAVILTMTLAIWAAGGATPGWNLLWAIPLQLAVGAVIGFAVARGTAWLFRTVRLTTGGLYPVVTLATAFVAFGAATISLGSGFLAVYIAGLTLGNRPLPYRAGLTRVHDAVAWMSQIGMFGMLGLLVFPSRLPAVAGEGLAIALFLALVARPLSVVLCLQVFRFPPREVAYLSWVGLRGAVPIILATYPVLRQVPGAERIFDIVFFVVVINAVVPGSTIRPITRRLKLDVPQAPVPAAALDITSASFLQGEVLPFYIDDSLAVSNVPLSKIPFPSGSAAVLVIRGKELLACRGDTVLKPGDHVYICCRPEDRAYVQLLFGRPQGA